MKSCSGAATVRLQQVLSQRQIIIPPDFLISLWASVTWYWLVDKSAQNRYCDCVDIYVPPCVNNQCTIVTSEDSLLNLPAPFTAIVTIETVLASIDLYNDQDA